MPWDGFVAMMLLVFTVTGICGALLIFVGMFARLFRVIGSILLILCLLSFFSGISAGAMFDEESALNIETNKTYSEPEVVSTEEIPLRALDEIPHYLVRSNGELLCRSAYENSKEPLRADESQCKFRFCNEEPTLEIQAVETKYHAEWLFLYADRVKQEQKIIITIPSKGSILNLDE